MDEEGGPEETSFDVDTGKAVAVEPDALSLALSNDDQTSAGKNTGNTQGRQKETVHRVFRGTAGIDINTAGRKPEQGLSSSPKRNSMEADAAKKKAALALKSLVQRSKALKRPNQGVAKDGSKKKTKTVEKKQTGQGTPPPRRTTADRRSKKKTLEKKQTRQDSPSPRRSRRR